MPFQTPITIKAALERMQAHEYVLPAIQREFVWGTDQIAALFDSLMKGYPIGSFLFWKVDPAQRDVERSAVPELPVGAAVVVKE